MQRYGELLKAAREEKNITLDRASAETTINSRYLKALEEEESEIFPGEPYLVGFLRNYSTYLELNPDTLIALYRNKKIQSAPAPEGLIVKRKPKYLIPLIIVMILVICAVVAAFVFIDINKKNNIDETVIVSKDMNTHSYTLDDKVLQQRVYTGDHIIVPCKQGNITLTVADTVGRFSLRTPVGNQIVDLSEELEIDIDGDSKKDIIVYVSDVSSATVDRGAEIRVMLKKSDTDKVAVINEKHILTVDASSKKDQVTVLEDNRAYPFTLRITFRGSTLFRYKKDYDASVEGYYSTGNIITITANNGFRVWMSNGNAMKVQLLADSNTYNLDIGKAGKVIVEDIKWIKDTDGKYKIVVIPVD